MNLKNLAVLIIAINTLGLLVACQDSPALPIGETIVSDAKPTLIEPTAVPTTESAVVLTTEPTNMPITESMPTLTTEPMTTPESASAPLPERAGLRTQTSGTVPHIQIGVDPIAAVNDELFRRAFTLPGVEDMPTIVSLPGARGMWLSDDVAVVNPQAIVNGREFAHIHPDGSLHAPLPYERALEVAEKGWGERHPWADQRDGWEGFVMLYTPLTMEELDVTFQLIVESYNHVTGQTIQASDIK